jgi:hypothetical protein
MARDETRCTNLLTLVKKCAQPLKEFRVIGDFLRDILLEEHVAEGLVTPAEGVEKGGCPLFTVSG